MRKPLSIAIIGAGMGGLAAAAALLNGAGIDDCTKWWGEDRHIVIYYVKPDRSEIYLVTSQPEPDFRIESWSAKGDVRELRKAFAGFDRQVEQVLAACPDVHKWAIVDRNSRKARTERIQHTSRANTWLSGKTDTDWVYGYDAWTVPLAA